MNEIARLLPFIKIVRDFTILFILCFLFEYAKGHYFFGETFYQKSLLGGIVFISIFGALFCFPAILCGLHLKESYFWFAGLAWLTWGIDILWSLYAGRNLSYRVGDVIARKNGDFTFFGFFYQEILSVTFLLVIYATLLLVYHYVRSGRCVLNFKPKF